MNLETPTYTENSLFFVGEYDGLPVIGIHTPEKDTSFLMELEVFEALRRFYNDNCIPKSNEEIN